MGGYRLGDWQIGGHLIGVYRVGCCPSYKPWKVVHLTLSTDRDAQDCYALLYFFQPCTSTFLFRAFHIKS